MNPVSTDVSAPLAVITIDRYDRRNALDLDTWLALSEAFKEVEVSTGVRSIIITGAGGVFSAGGDLRSDISMGRGVRSPVGRLQVSHRVLRQIYHSELPTIAAIEGYAIGMGFNLALACDFVVMSREAYLQAPFVNIGLVPDGGIIWSLTRHLGHQRAGRLLVLGEKVNSTDAERWGLVSHLSESGDALDEAEVLAQQVARGPRDAIAITRTLMRTALESTQDVFLRAERDSVNLNFYGSDATEGLDAFRERREPKYR